MVLPPSPGQCSFSLSVFLYSRSNKDVLNVSFILATCDYSTASKAFIFSLYNTKGYNPVKLTQNQSQENAMYGCSNYGPTFGNSRSGDYDIYISNNALSNQNSYTRCGSTYSLPPGYSAGDCRFFVGAAVDKFTPTDIEVFYEIGNNFSKLYGFNQSNPVDKRLADNARFTLSNQK